MMSIRRRLLMALVALWITVWVAVALIALDRSGHEVAELLDAQMAQTAHVLREITLEGALPDSAMVPPTLLPVGHPYEFKLSFQRWRADRLVASFGAAPAQPLAQGTGFSDQDLAGARWRVFGLPGTLPEEMLYVGQNYTIRQELIGFLTIQALKPILWSLPVSVLLIWVAVTDGLRPLNRLARAIERRSAQRLDPIDGYSVPAEIRPLIDALNGLMERLDHALAAERRFAADASHELRTPCAVIRTHAQIARRSQDHEEQRRALDNLIQGVDRASHLIDQLMTLVHLEGDQQVDRPADQHGRDSACLVRVVTRLVEERQAAARARSIALTVAVAADAAPCLVGASPAALDILIANLVENALKYTPPGGQVEVAVRTRPGERVLRVTDSGPGIPVANRRRVFDRFYRPAGQSEPGAGLGLSIVRGICDLHGARIELRDGVGGAGLCCEVTFPEPSFAPPDPSEVTSWA